MFSGCTVLSDITNTELGSSNQEVYLSAGKITGVDLVSCCAWKLVPTAISGSVDISEAPGCHFLQQIISQWGSQKLLQGLVSHELTAYLSFFDPFLTKWIMAILSNEWKPGTFESHNSLQLSFEVLQQIFEALIQILLNVNLSWIKLSWHCCSDQLKTLGTQMNYPIRVPILVLRKKQIYQDYWQCCYGYR